MTAEERRLLRAAVDRRRREQVAFDMRARDAAAKERRARLLAACGPCVPPVRRENQVRSVLRMLDQQAKRITTAPAATALDGSIRGGRKEDASSE